MKHIADRFVVILDANVLFPYRKRDILLGCFHAGLFRARWTERIVDEWTRSLLEQKPELETSIRSQQAAMQREFPDALVTGFERFIKGLDLPDPDDRHVLAAAIRCGAEHIVTENLRDFPSATLDEFGIEAIDTDEFLSRTFDLYPTETFGVLRTLRRQYDNPPFTPAEFTFDLTAKGLPKLAARVRPQRDLL